MLTNYFKLAIRLLIRNPFFTFINILGLSVGFAVFFIFWPFAQSELQSDQFRKDHDRIARVLMDWRWTENGGESWGQIMISGSPSMIGSELHQKYKQILDYTRFKQQASFSEGVVGLGTELVISLEGDGQETLFKEENAICADHNLFDFFSIPFIYGDQKTALKIAGSVVLSHQTALKYFGEVDPTGFLIRVNRTPYQVTGVFEEIPPNSHLHFNMVFSNAEKLALWNSSSPWVYNYLKTTQSTKKLEQILADNKEHFIGDWLKKNQQVRIKFLTQPLDEIVFSENFANDEFLVKSQFILILLSIVSIIVLAMAWMNYINLAISQINSRLKEIATRKVSGAKMADVFVQFICQSAVTNLLAAFIGLTIIQLVRQTFADVFSIRVLEFSQLNTGTLIFFILIFVIGTLLTAAYPAWVAMRSTSQLLTKYRSSPQGLVPSILTTFQYATAMVLIVWIFAVYYQIVFILNKDLGINKDHIIALDAPILEDNKQIKLVDFANEVRKIPAIKNVTFSSRVLGDLRIADVHLRRFGKDVFYGSDSHGGVDENFLPVHEIKLLAGRNFIVDERPGVILISQYASQRLGFANPEDAIGQKIEAALEHGPPWNLVEIIGVFRDYRVKPYYVSQNSTEDISGRGQSLTYLSSVFTLLTPQRISIKISGNRFNEIIPDIEKRFREAFPGNLFGWYFLEDHISRHYNTQKVIRNQILFFTILAIGVACLGLLGMISNKVVEKTKEIGIRKVLGARMDQIAQILLRPTLRQVTIATFVSLPAAHYLVQLYLERFAERISLQWWHYVLPSAVLVVILFSTIVSVLLKASRSNPVEALKYE